MDHPPLSSPNLHAGHCCRLKHKGMYVMAEQHAADDHFFDKVDSAAYWCSHTQTAFGPDGEPVGPQSCLHHRTCCE